MPEKKVDGIKKLNKKDLEKSRKIVLDSIGEVVKPAGPEVKSIATKSFKKMDSIISPKIISDRDKELLNNIKAKEQLERKRLEQKKRWREEMKRMMSPINKDLIKEKTRFGLSKLRQAKPGLAPDFMKVGQKKVMKPVSLVASREKQRTEKKKSALAKAMVEKQEEAKMRKMSEQEKEERKRKKIEEKRIKQAQRRQKAKDIKIKIVNNLARFFLQLKIISRKSVYIILVSLVVGLLFYSILAILVLKFAVDTNLTRHITKYFPVPALITENGLVEYYTYKDLKMDMAVLFQTNDELEQAVKLAMVEKLILSDLTRKYNLSPVESNFDTENLKELIAKKIAFDRGINQVAINRINKIKQIIDTDNDFVLASTKYGDEQGQVNISPANQDLYSYGQAVKDLAINEISNIIITPEGYYIFRCYDRTNELIALSYVFIRAKTLDKYLEEETKSIKLWSLVD